MQIDFFHKFVLMTVCLVKGVCAVWLHQYIFAKMFLNMTVP